MGFSSQAVHKAQSAPFKAPHRVIVQLSLSVRRGPLTLGILNILNLIQSHNAIAQPSAILQQIVHLNN